jgi:O-antigen ligase
MLAAYSRTAILGFVVSVALLKLCIRRDIKAVLLWSALVLLAALTFLLGDTYGEVLVAFLSRGQRLETVETLNSRTFVWNAALQMISESPWVGHGFGVGAKHLRYYAEVFKPLHAHNDVLNAAVDTGFFGAALLIFVYIVFLVKSIRRAWRDPRYALPAALGTCVFIYSLTEPVLSREVLAPGVVLVACLRVVSVLSAQRKITRLQGLTLQEQRSAATRTSGVRLVARRA